MKFASLFSILALALTVDASTDEAPHGRRLGGYSESFCERSLRDCCGPQDAAEGVTDDIPFPSCKCPKRKKGGLEEPYWFFGSYGGDDGICATCAGLYDIEEGNVE